MEPGHSSSPPSGLSRGGAATTGVKAPKRIYVIGGCLDPWSDALNFTQVYNPQKDTWSLGADMPTPRYDLAVAVVEDSLYAIGGIKGPYGSPIEDANERYTPAGWIPEFPSWTPILLLMVVVIVAAVVYNRKREH